MGWFILNKYYGKSDETPVYVAALLLDPSKRDAYIKQNWRKEWYEPAIVGADSVWEADFNINLTSDSPAVPVRLAISQFNLQTENLNRKSRTETSLIRFSVCRSN
jgi:hypothetical protein